MEKEMRLDREQAKSLQSRLFADLEDDSDRRSDIRRYISTIKGRYQPKEGESSNKGDLFYLLGSNLIEEGKNRFAARALEKSLEFNDRDDIEERQIHDRLSTAYEKIGNYDGALAHLNKAIIGNGERNLGYLVRKGQILLKQGKTIEAYRMFEEIVSEDPTELEAYDGMLQIEAENKNYSGFADVAQDMKDKNPGNGTATDILSLRIAQITEKGPGKVIQGSFGKKR